MSVSRIGVVLAASLVIQFLPFKSVAPAFAASSIDAHEELLGQKGPKADPGDKLDTPSPDGHRVAWREKRDAGWVVLVNGERQGGAYREVESLRFHGDGSRFAFKAKDGTGWLAVIDGDPGRAYKNVFSPTFSDDGQRYAYPFQAGSKWGVVVDGEVSMRLDGRRTVEELYDEVGPLQFSADGKKLAFRVRQGKREMVVLNDAPGSAYEDVGDPLFTPEGMLVYPAKRNDVWVVVAEGKKSGPEWRDIWRGDLVVQRKFIARGLPWARFHDQVGLIYFGRTESGWEPVADETLGPGFDAVTWPIFFGPHGDRFAYAGADFDYAFGRGARGVGQVIVDGKAGPAYEGIPKNSFGGSTLGFALGLAAGFYPPGGVPEGVLPRLNVHSFGVSSPAVSPDGEHIAYSARRDHEDYVVVLDGELSTSFKSISCGPIFTDDGTLVYVGVDGDELVLVKDGEPTDRFTWKDADCTRMITMGEQVVYIAAHDDERRVFVNGDAGRSYEVKTTSIRAFDYNDELHVAQVVLGKKDKADAFVVLDDQEGERYDDVFRSSLQITDEGSIVYVARRGRAFFRVTRPIR